jgi:membrane carboxypeptidase/penicillin-binding protein
MTKPGVVLSGPIWHNFMVEALKNYPKEEFKKPEEIITGKPVLDGEILEESHSILYYVEKKDPQGEIPEDPSTDLQYLNWEYSVNKYFDSF